MPILQHYYTSFYDSKTGEGGFRTRAKSQGLEPQVVDALLKRVSYRIPPGLDERRPETHPVALRYGTLRDGDHVIMCVQSCGGDEHGRPGNLFAHSLVVSSGDLPTIHPITLWRNPEWQTSDPDGSSVLPELAQLNWAPAIGPDAVRAFLSVPGRAEWLAQLLGAVVNTTANKGRRIVIVDEPDNVAMWVCALAVALPSPFRPLLTFSSYHYDPYQSDYLITGTVPDSMLRGSQQDFVQFVVLDVPNRRLSDIAPMGAYAACVARSMATEDAEADLQVLRKFCERRAGQSPSLDGRLDELALLFERLGDSSPQSTDTIASVLARTIDEIVSAGVIDAEDANDLAMMMELARSMLAPNPEPRLLAAYANAMPATKKYDSGFSLYLGDEIQIVAQWVCTGQNDNARVLMDAIVRSHGEEAFVSELNSPGISKALAREAGNTLTGFAALWSGFGRAVSFEATEAPFLTGTCAALDEAGDSASPPPSAVPLIRSMVAASAGRETDLLRVMLDWWRQHDGHALDWVYYALVADRPLDERVELRRAVVHDNPGIAGYEVARDVGRAPQNDLRTALGAWVNHVRGDAASAALVTASGLDALWRATPALSQPALARQALSWAELRSMLPEEWEHALVNTAFSGMTLRAPDASEVALLTQYADHPGLSDETRNLVELRMSLGRGRLDQNNFDRMQHRFRGLSPSQYKEDATEVLKRFVAPEIPISDYANAVRAVYAREHGFAFWLIHWTVVAGHIQELPTQGISSMLPFGRGRSEEVDAVTRDAGTWLSAILEFWFDRALPLVANEPYLAQEFFLHLPEALSSLQDARQWKSVALAIEESASRKAWYAIVEPLLTHK